MRFGFVDLGAVGAMLAAAITPPALRPARPTPPIRILLVEDDEQLGPLLAAQIRRQFEPIGGATVDLVMTIDAALARLALHKFDAIVLDLYLPDSHGLHTVRELARSRPVPLPVILATSGHELSEAEQVEAVRLGAQAFISKSEIAANPAILRARIRTAIARVAEAYDLKGEWESLSTRIRAEAGVDPGGEGRD